MTLRLLALAAFTGTAIWYWGWLVGHREGWLDGRAAGLNEKPR